MMSFQHTGEENALSSILALTGTIFYSLVLASEILALLLSLSSALGRKLTWELEDLTSTFHYKLSVGLLASSLNATFRHCSTKCCNTEV